jgi:hypothetical protein
VNPEINKNDMCKCGHIGLYHRSSEIGRYTGLCCKKKCDCCEEGFQFKDNLKYLEDLNETL